MTSKIKKIILLIAIFTLSLTLFACGETKTEIQTEINVETVQINLDLFETKKINYTTNYDGETLLLIENQEIATLNGNKIYGKGVGETKLTITAGDVQKEITVTVNKGSNMPTFDAIYDVNYLTLNKTVQLDTSMSLKGENFANASFVFETTGDVLEVSDTGLVTAKTLGKQIVTVKAFYGNVQLAKANVEITVKEFGYVDTGISANKLYLSVTTYNQGSISEYSFNNIVPRVDGNIANYELRYSIDNNDICYFDNGILKAKKVGTTFVNVEFTANSGIKYDTNIEVIVLKETINGDVSFLVGQDNDKNSVIDLSSYDIKIQPSEINEVTLNGKNIPFSVSGSSLNLNNAPSGINSYKLTTDNLDVIISGKVYQNAISTKQELINFFNSYNTCSKYTVLLNDIDLEGEVLKTQEGAWLRFVFDGCGHTVSNFITEKGIFPSINEKGKIQDIQFVNVLLDNSLNANASEYGVIGKENLGSLENVLILAKIQQVVNNQSLLYSCEYTSTTINNVIAVINTDKVDVEGIYGVGGYYVQAEGGIANGFYMVSNCTAVAKQSKCKKNNIVLYSSEQSMLDNASFDSFEKWQVNDKLPCLNDYQQALRDFSVKYVGEVESNNSLTVYSTLYDGSYIKENDANLQIIGNVIQLGNNFTKAVVNVVSENNNSIFKPIKLLTVSTGEYLESVVKTENGKTYLDKTKIKDLNGREIKSIIKDGGTVNYQIDGDFLIVDSSDAGNVDFIIELENDAFKISVLVADLYISNQEQLKMFRENNANYKYAVLTQDITCDGSTDLSINGTEYVSTLDGLGFTVKNAYFRYGWSKYSANFKGGTIKNITFDNYIIAENGIFGGYMEGGYIENVTINATYKTGYNLNGAWTSVLCHMATGRGENTVMFKNCNFNITVPEMIISSAIKLYQDEDFYSTIMENVIVTSNGLIAGCDEEDYSGEIKVHSSKTQWTNVTVISNYIDNGD